jgi:prevent-host-death family protein
MIVESDKIISITKLQRELTQTLREVSETGESVYIMKNNEMEAVMMPFVEYEQLKVLEEIFEQREIQAMIESRMKHYNPRKQIDWDKIKED